MITQIRAHFCTWFWFKTPKNYKKRQNILQGGQNHLKNVKIFS